MPDAPASPLDRASIEALEGTGHLGCQAVDDISHSRDAFFHGDAGAAGSGFRRDGARMQDRRQDPTLSELDGDALYCHIQAALLHRYA